MRNEDLISGNINPIRALAGLGDVMMGQQTSWLRKAGNPPKICVINKGKRYPCGGLAYAQVLVKEAKGKTLLIIDDGQSKQLALYVNGFFIRKRVRVLKAN